MMPAVPLMTEALTLLDADVDAHLVAQLINKLCRNVKSGGISLGALKAAAKRHKVPVHQSSEQS